MTQDDDQVGELNIAFLGTSLKHTLFDKLCQSASKYERHVHYPDVHYLTLNTGVMEEVIEVNDPGLARTGGREMAIKKADLILLYYSSLSMTSFQQLSTLKEDLHRRNNVPIRLICDTDEVVEEDDDSNSTGISSLSEGYESDTDRETIRKRKTSMEKIRAAHEDGVTTEQGEQLCRELGPSCTFIQLSSSQWNKGEEFLRDMIKDMRSHKKTTAKGLLTKFKRPKSKEPKKNKDDKEDKSNSKWYTESGSDGSTSTSTRRSSVQSSEEKPSRKKSDVNNSKVCVVM